VPNHFLPLVKSGSALADRPTAAPCGRVARPPKAGRFVGLSGPQQPCPAPARLRAPLAAVGGKARANNRGLACKEAEPVMGKFDCGEARAQTAIGLKTLPCALPVS